MTVTIITEATDTTWRWYCCSLIRSATTPPTAHPVCNVPCQCPSKVMAGLVMDWGASTSSQESSIIAMIMPAMMVLATCCPLPLALSLQVQVVYMTAIDWGKGVVLVLPGWSGELECRQTYATGQQSTRCVPPFASAT